MSILKTCVLDGTFKEIFWKDSERNPHGSNKHAYIVHVLYACNFALCKAPALDLIDIVKLSAHCAFSYLIESFTCQAILSRLRVSSRVLQPRREEANAASQPACPAPTITTS